MTRRDFELIAEALSKAREAARVAYAGDSDLNAAIRRDGVKLAAEAVADMCRAQNANFNRARFLAACGL